MNPKQDKAILKDDWPEMTERYVVNFNLPYDELTERLKHWEMTPLHHRMLRDIRLHIEENDERYLIQNIELRSLHCFRLIRPVYLGQPPSLDPDEVFPPEGYVKMQLDFYVRFKKHPECISLAMSGHQAHAFFSVPPYGEFREELWRSDLVLF